MALLFPLLAAATPLNVEVLYLKQTTPRPPTLSTREIPPPDAGPAGALVAVGDSNTTGRFLGHHYALEIVEVDSGDEAIAQARAWLNSTRGIIVADLPSQTLAELVALKSQQVPLILNATNPDDAWRVSECRPYLLHTTPSRAMLADALAQFLIARRWREWFLVKGPRPEDEAFANAMKRSARRFGGKIVAEKTWSFDTDLRRTAQSELPLFTQASDYDAVLIADEIGDVGEFVPYNTWLPRPVVGTQGLVPAAWSPVLEQWGALQLQNRFTSEQGRGMTSADYGAWLAIRAVAEAVTRTGSNSAENIYDYLVSEEFELAAFLGRSLTFRSWNGQIRQPITLVQPKAAVSQSPQTGFLHPGTELDTLGFDAPEVNCRFKG